MRNCLESDWQIFKENIAKWQENYLDKLNSKYIKLLTSDKNASDKFWELEKRINLDKKNKGLLLTMSRSKLFYNLLALYNEGIITDSEIKMFSQELQNDIKMVLKF